MFQGPGPLVLGQHLPLVILLLLLHQLQDPVVLIRSQPVAVLTAAEFHLQIVEPVMEFAQG